MGEQGGPGGLPSKSQRGFCFCSFPPQFPVVLPMLDPPFSFSYLLRFRVLGELLTGLESHTLELLGKQPINLIIIIRKA